MSNSYRPDIDGLRAVAVSGVILFHAPAPGFGGGFVGVDIFFVISGFLISGIILREMGEGRFLFADFYKRRVRRILPVLLFVLSSTAFLAWQVLLPDDFVQFGENLFATLLMVPNIAAWRISKDYFAPTVVSNPQLHLWSLGVEEQFYFFFPLLLVFFVKKFSPRTCWVMFCGGFIALSLSFAFWAVLNRPGFAFYWLPARAWEFFLVSVWPIIMKENHKPQTTNHLSGMNFWACLHCC